MEILSSKPVERRAIRDNGRLPDGTQGTITSGPRLPINLIEILDQASRGATRGGAVSGSAHVQVSDVRSLSGPERGIALSDGSMISFASIEDAGVLRHDLTGLFRRDDAPARRVTTREVGEIHHLAAA